jgi:putative hemolysin
MKKIQIFTIILIVLTGCAPLKPQMAPDDNPTDLPGGAISNPASVFCMQTGNKLEIRISADGSQTGNCVFPDGSSCEEWAYLRGECGQAAQESSAPTVVDHAPASASDDGQIGNEAESSMLIATTERVEDWSGIIKSFEPGAQFDDYFERNDQGQVKSYGIDSMDLELRTKIETLRDSGVTVHLYGILTKDVPDHNGSQIKVDRIEVEENIISN